MPDKVAHQYIDHIVVDHRHIYTDQKYSNPYQIAMTQWAGYIPSISTWRPCMIRGIKIVSIPVSNQDAALKFYIEQMGFKVATDQAFGPGQRWIELLIPVM